MTRRRSSRDNPLASEPAAGPRDYGQTGTARAPTSTVLCDLCRAHYVDDEPGHQAHRVVFNHTPRQPQPAAKDGG